MISDIVGSLLDPQNALGLSGISVSLAAWLDQRSASSKTETIEEYLEWLRRENHSELVDLIMSQSAEVKVGLEFLIRSLNAQTTDQLRIMSKALVEGNR